MKSGARIMHPFMLRTPAIEFEYINARIKSRSVAFNVTIIKG